MIEVDGFKFPDEAIDFLRQHKEGPFVSPEHECQNQVRRAFKQFSGIEHLLRGLRPKRIVDIGCGLAMVDVLIARVCKVAAIHLLDGDGTGERKGGFHDELSPWTDVWTSEKLVTLNTDPSQVEVHGHVVGKGCGLPVLLPADLVLSMKSWGYHYPISTYLDWVKRLVRPGGLVILNATETDADEQMERAGFSMIESGFAYRRV